MLDPCIDSDVALIDCNEAGEIVALSSDPYEIFRVDISKQIYNWDCFNTSRKKIRSQCKTALELFEMVDPKTPYSSFAKRYIQLKIQDKPYEAVICAALNELNYNNNTLP